MSNPSSRHREWLVIVSGLGAIVGMLWLAAAITARPHEALDIAKKFGGLIWLVVAAGWSGTSLAKKMTRSGAGHDRER